MAHRKARSLPFDGNTDPGLVPPPHRMEFRHSHNPCPPCDASDKTTCPSPEPRLLSHTVPPPPLPALDSPAWYAPTTPSGLANSPVDSPPLLPLLPDAKYTADFAVSARSVPVPMLISSRRWLIGVVATLCTLGWLWHVAVVDRVAPDVWSRADYAEAESVLEGWRAAVCKNAGLCGNFYSKSASTNFKNVHQGGVVENLGDPSTPDFVVEYGEASTNCAGNFADGETSTTSIST